MNIKTNRRGFILGTSVVAATALFDRPFCRTALAGDDKPHVISQRPQIYHGWPTLARRRNGDLLLVWSGGREAHVCPFGRVEWMISKDDGESWSWPRTLLDGPIDDRDAGVVETAKGALLVTTFTSLAYETNLARMEAEAAKTKKVDEQLSRWRAVQRRLSPAQRQQELGVWMIRSTDGGATWSSRYPSLVNSPHGPIQLSDGRLLYAGKELWAGENLIGVCESTDDGLTWSWLATIPTRPGDDHKSYHELHAVEADGKLIVHIRNHNRRHAGETLQTESTDGGKTWSTPHEIGVWGLPSHLLRLADGRLLMTYGHRRAPFGNQARLSNDNGGSWSEPIVVSDDGVAGDLGYPSTVQLADGRLVSVWYERLAGSPRAALRQTTWRLG